MSLWILTSTFMLHTPSAVQDSIMVVVVVVLFVGFLACEDLGIKDLTNHSFHVHIF